MTRDQARAQLLGIVLGMVLILIMAGVASYLGL